MKVLNNLRISDKHICKEIYNEENFNISLKEIKRIIGLFLSFMASQVLEGYCISIPHNLGKFRIIGKKPKSGHKDYVIDYQESKKQGKTIYHNNDHTDGFTYGFKWIVKNHPIINKAYYKFILSKPNKIKMNKLIVAGKVYKNMYI